MALNYPGPYEVRLVYTDVGIVHSARYNLNIVGSPAPLATFDFYQALQADSTDAPLDTLVDAWVALVKAIYPAATCNFNYAELWKYTPGTFLAEYYSTYDISVAGTNGSSSNATNQDIFSFRTKEGGSMKLNFMSCVMSFGARQSYTAMDADRQAIVDYVLSDDDWIIGRDTSYPAGFVYRSPGQNEALFKKVYRP